MSGRIMCAGRRSPRRLDTGRPPRTPGKMTSVRANSCRPISPDSRKPTTVMTTHDSCHPGCFLQHWGGDHRGRLSAVWRNRTTRVGPDTRHFAGCLRRSASIEPSRRSSPRAHYASTHLGDLRNVGKFAFLTDRFIKQLWHHLVGLTSHIS